MREIKLPADELSDLHMVSCRCILVGFGGLIGAFSCFQANLGGEALVASAAMGVSAFYRLFSRGGRLLELESEVGWESEVEGASQRGAAAVPSSLSTIETSDVLR